MRLLRILQACAVTMASLPLIFPTHAALAASPPARNQPSETAAAPVGLVCDVALDQNSQLRGKLVDASGNPLAHEQVQVWRSNQPARQAVTDEQGRFLVTDLRGGVYQVQTRDRHQVFRCWASNTAPPVAVTELLLVPEQMVQRGQAPIGEVLSGPVLIGLIIAAAIIIPIAVHKSRDSAS